MTQKILSRISELVDEFAEATEATLPGIRSELSGLLSDLEHKASSYLDGRALVGKEELRDVSGFMNYFAEFKNSDDYKNLPEGVRSKMEEFYQPALAAYETFKPKL